MSDWPSSPAPPTALGRQPEYDCHRCGSGLQMSAIIIGYGGVGKEASSIHLRKSRKRLGADRGIPAIAIAYVMQKTPYVFPIIGGRKVEHLMANVQTLTISLSDEQMKYLESIIPFSPGFPYTLIVS